MNLKGWALATATLLISTVALFAAPGLELKVNGKVQQVVQAVKSNNVTYVALDQVVQQWGMKGTMTDDQYNASGKGSQLQITHNSAAVWLNGSLVALPRAAQIAKGVCWVDKNGAVKLLSMIGKAIGQSGAVSWGGVSQTQEPSSKVKTEKMESQSQATTQSGQSQGLGKILSVRMGDNGDFVRYVFDCSELGSIDVQQSNKKLMLNCEVSDLSFIPETQYLKYKDYKTKTKQLCLEFPLGGEKVFWLKEPRRLVVDLPKKEGVMLSVTPHQLNQGDPKPSSAKDDSPVVSPQPTVKPVETVKSSQREEKEVPLPKEEKPIVSYKKKPLVMIDPGHGGKDTGATRGSYQEKEIALQIAKKLKTALSRYGVDSRLTREGDTYPTLSERPAMANSLKADAFVSIHLNSLAKKSGSARGQEIYIMALPTDKDAMNLAKVENVEFSKEGHKIVDSGKTDALMTILANMQQSAKISDSTVMAEDIYNQGENASIQMRRVAQAPFAVLRGAAMPAVLVETGFITHPEEVKLLASPAYQTKLAEAIAKGLANYLKKTTNP